jgi:hypothetical protein
MRWLLIGAILPGVLSALAPANNAPQNDGLQIAKAVISDREGGAPDPSSFEYRAGETIYFTCRIAGFSKTDQGKIHVAYDVQAFDAQGAPLAEIYKKSISEEITAQDKDWMPKIETSITIPPLVLSGTYKVVVKAEDLLAKTTTELSFPFKVRGYSIESSDSMVVRNFRFLRNENDAQPAEKPVYRSGDSVWAKFDIIGYHYGPNNRVDVSYVTSVIAPDGKVLWTQPEPAVEQSDSFYPKRYVPAEMNISLQGKIQPGVYTLVVTGKDAVSSQTCESKHPFTVE